MTPEEWTAVGTWVGSIATVVIGFVGWFFIHRQNSILEKQTEIFGQQTELMENQKELNKILIESELSVRRRDDLKEKMCSILMDSFVNTDERDRRVVELFDLGLTEGHVRRLAQTVLREEALGHGPYRLVDDCLGRLKQAQKL